MRPIRLQDRRGTKIAAIKKVKRESRGSEEGAPCCENCHGRVYLVCLSPGWIRFSPSRGRRVTEGVISFCHFCYEMSSTAEIQTKHSPVFFCQRQKKKKDKSSVVTVQLGLFLIIEAIDDGRCSHWLQLQPLIPVGLKIAARVLISHLFVIQVLFLKCGGGATNSNNRAALLPQNPNKRHSKQRNRTAANV